MASNANVGAGLNLGKFAQATELRQRIWFTLGALIIFRLLSFVPLPGIDPVALQQVISITQDNTGGGGILPVKQCHAEPGGQYALPLVRSAVQWGCADQPNSGLTAPPPVRVAVRQGDTSRP